MNLRRRQLALLAFAPAAAPAQPAAGVHRIGTLSGGSSPKAKDQPNWPHVFAAMNKLGYEEGRNSDGAFGLVAVVEALPQSRLLTIGARASGRAGVFRSMSSANGLAAVGSPFTYAEHADPP